MDYPVLSDYYENFSLFTQNSIRKSISPGHPHFQSRDLGAVGEAFTVGLGQEIRKVSLVRLQVLRRKGVLKTTNHMSRPQAVLRGHVGGTPDPPGSF